MDQKEQEARKVACKEETGRAREHGQDFSGRGVYRKCVPRSSGVAATLTVLFSEDLEGLKVSHDFTEMEDGEARILTLKDSRILDNEGLDSTPSTINICT